MQRTSLKPHQVALLTAALVSVVLWAVPVAQFLMLPMQYLNTHLHELCHALAAQTTGGQAAFIKVFANGSGVTPSMGGSILIIASAGYVGAALIGSGIVLASRSEAATRTMFRVLALVLGLAMIIWVRGDWVGIVSGIGWVAGLYALSRYATGMTLLFAGQFIGVQQCLNSVQSIYVLLNVSALTDAHSDAAIMEQTYGVPALLWAIGWTIFSLTAMFLALRQAWSTPVRSRRVG